MDRVVIRPDPQPDPTATPAPEVTVERPAWLPEKFKTPEDMAKAYGDLERRLSTGPKPPAPTPPAEGQFNFEAAVQEYMQQGSLSEATAKILPAGMTSEVISTFVTGQQARANQFKASIAETVGGVEKMDAIFKWAEAKLTPGEVAAYNNAAASGDAKAAAVALLGLATMYQKDTGNEPNLQSGPGTPSSVGAKPYGSWAQVTADIKNPQYDADPAFREEVKRRLAVSRI